MKLLILVLAFACPALAFADDAATDRINPFGTIEWSDSFGTVITKIKGIQGVDRVTVSVTGLGKTGVPVTDANVNDPSALVEEAIKRWNPFYLDPNKRGKLPVLTIEKYRDDKGMEQSYPLKYFSIEGYPVAISGAPFKIIAEFHPLPGYAVVHPEGVVSAGGYRVPLALISVTLASVDAAVIAAAPDIEATLTMKYKRFASPEADFIFPDRSTGFRAVSFGASAHDSSGASLDVYCCFGAYVIKYEYRPERKLQDAYVKHVASLTKTTGPDQKKGL